MVPCRHVQIDNNRNHTTVYTLGTMESTDILISGCSVVSIMKLQHSYPPRTGKRNGMKIEAITFVWLA